MLVLEANMTIRTEIDVQFKECSLKDGQESLIIFEDFPDFMAGWTEDRTLKRQTL